MNCKHPKVRTLPDGLLECVECGAAVGLASYEDESNPGWDGPFPEGA